jgi:hypothetical protein
VCVLWIFQPIPLLRRGADAVSWQYVRDEPLSALAIAAAAGFIVGGGLNSRIGQAMLAIVGRITLQSVATSLIAGMVAGIHENGRPNRTSPHS